MTIDLNALKKKYVAAKDAYYNKPKALMTDAQFDKLEDKIRKLDPKWPELRKTGTAVHKAQVALRHFMPSLHKMYPEHVAKWLGKNKSSTYQIMDKLDGTSLQLTVKNGWAVSLHTRGDGETGKDVSHLLPHVKLPKKLMQYNGVHRLEAVMKKATFEKKWASKFDNARQCVNGVFNRKEPSPELKDIDLVTLGVYGQNIANGLSNARKFGFDTVPCWRLDKIDGETLERELKRRKKKSVYEIDGLVVASSGFVLDYSNNDKPGKGIIAFKFNDADDMVKATVKQIIWQVTGRGRIVPKIEIEPTRIGGVTVKHATAHNAKMMVDKGIGPGAVIMLVRSGGVIPYIDSVIRKGKFQPPEIAYKQEGVHFVVNKASEETKDRIDVLNLVKFFSTLGIEGLKSKSLTKLAMRDPLTFVRLWQKKQLRARLANVIGRNADAVTAEFDRVFSKPVHVRTMLTALQVYGVGIGERKLSQIEAAGLSLKVLVTSELERVREVRGFSAKTTKLLIDGRQDARRALKTAQDAGVKLSWALPVKKVKSGKLSGAFVTFTGYRDAEQEAAIEKAGGVVVPFGSKTTHLLVSPSGKASSKEEKAKARGVKVLQFAKLGL